MSRFFILFLFLFTSLFGEQETFPFIGVTVATHTVDLRPIATQKPNRPKNPSSETERTFGVQYGVQTQDFRTTVSVEGNNDFQSIDVEVDYIFMDSMFGTAKVRPYVGATLGYVRYNQKLIAQYNDNRVLDDELNDRNTTISNTNGFYGLDLGLLFYITDQIDLDVSYHYYYMDRLEPLDSMSGGTFAFHYFY